MKALIIVDCQTDFTENGSLPVPGGNAVCEKIAADFEDLKSRYDEILFTKDWHKDGTNNGHISSEPDFVDTWPAHCLAGSQGADFHPAIDKLMWGPSDEYQIFYKGQGHPAYSGFEGKNTRYISLDDYLKTHGIDQVDICGMAAEYCVKATALHAIELDYITGILPEYTAGFGDIQDAIDGLDSPPVV